MITGIWWCAYCSVLESFWGLIDLPVIFQQPRPGPPLPKGESYFTIGWKQVFHHVDFAVAVVHRPITFCYRYGQRSGHTGNFHTHLFTFCHASCYQMFVIYSPLFASSHSLPRIGFVYNFIARPDLPEREVQVLLSAKYVPWPCAGHHVCVGDIRILVYSTVLEDFHKEDGERTRLRSMPTELCDKCYSLRLQMFLQF